MQKRIYLCLAHMSGREMEFIQEAFDTNWVVPLGPNVNGFGGGLEGVCGGDKEWWPSARARRAVHLALRNCAGGRATR